ncbi:MAG: thioredoxin-dependent thiol peroxidase [Gammaproteobacteria bacterium]|nr:thioredoxin-dependent thiol peroxidase [Gammaproteobacteria bacterium]MDH3447168.1 thioredoxin-dependent thiol peroxidase [Gammaproteobacteria bacterium]
MLETNQPAPEFTSVNQDGDNVSLSQYRGDRNVVLYFYPKDDTPGCTTEANEFTGLIDEFAAADTVVLGVSKDSCAKHQKFIDKYGLRVELLADTGGELCELYGTWGPRKFMGREYMGIGRSTFVIDKQGKLAHVDYKVKAKGHAQAILEIVKGLE